ncbi:MAG: hypothetical protein ACM4D3_11175 [Candidatus Sericytochromatia bacterium]
MRLTVYRRLPTLALGVVSIVVLAALFAIVGPGGSGPASAAPSGCPNLNAIGNFKTATNVAASFSTSGNTTTYTFVSLTNENPTGGVPGLIDYCVYPTNPDKPPTATTVDVKNPAGWTAVVKKPPAFNSFSFSRPNGDNTNIPLDGNTTTMGTATWATVPNQEILLHINDPGVCNILYGGNPGTCFVKSGNLASVCDKGNMNLAYNANSYGAVNCYTAAQGFECCQTNEFGDAVQLAGSATGLAKLDVLFASYGCGTSGHWNTGDCVTNSPPNFTVPITAKIYDKATLTPIATVNQNVTIPFRPSADNRCTGADAGKWFNPDGAGGGRCQNSIGTIITFPLGGTALPSGVNQVVWTVQFNTTTSGYHPIGASTCSVSSGGCGYDSLNVGTTDFLGAPYAGTDLNASTAYSSTQTQPALHEITISEGRPLGAITTQ